MVTALLALLLSTPAIEHRTVARHPMQYLVSRPDGWSVGKAWPVVVTIPAAERDFEAYCQAFVRSRGARPYIVVTPYVLTNGGSNVRGIPEYPYDSKTWDRIESDGHWAFDIAGLEAVLHEVQTKDGGEPGAYLTGLEAAGHTVFAVAFDRPDLLRAAAPVAPNYQGRWVTFPADRTSVSLPVRVFAGSLDEGWGAGKPLYDQAQTGIKAAKDHGFTDVLSVVVAGKGHEPMADAVLAWFDSLRK